VTIAEEFTDFATTASPRLRRTAFLLCGDWHAAEDLAQITLTKMFVSWRRVRRRESADAYAMRTLVNTYLAGRHGRRASELVTAELPERPDGPVHSELRLVVLGALATLPPRSRAVVVLRYWEDLSVVQVAGLLGCSEGNVKSQSARALRKLRVLLGDEVAESWAPAHERETRGA
jgi:RNA polymerase sigma-70 factor (sigma-E family)